MKFPMEACKAKIAAKWGLEAVALSGPDAGQPLVDCVCNQLSSRWEDISKKLAGKKGAVEKVAMALAENLSKADVGDKECLVKLQSLGYKKVHAAGITEYLKAYAMDKKLDSLVSSIVEKVAQFDGGMSQPAPAQPQQQEEMVSMGGDEPAPEGLDGGLDGAPSLDAPAAPDAGLDGGLDGGLDAGGPVDDLLVDDGMNEGGGNVTLELPVEVAQELSNMLNDQLMGLESVEDGSGAPQDDFEIVDVSTDEGGAPVEEVTDEVVPGEPADKQDGGSFVESDKTDESACATSNCAAPAEKQVDDKGASPEHTPGCPKCEADAKEAEPKHNHPVKGEGESKPEPKSEGKPDFGGGEKKDEGSEKSEAPSEESEDTKKEAAMALRSGRLQRVGNSVLKLGPEMSINNTDQQGGHSEKQLGNAKDKTVEDPKPLENGNVKPEGYTAGGNKFQDHGTLGKEEKFDAKEISKDEVSGGKQSIMGKDESFPEGKPEVPAGSAPIGGETWTGGDVATKGTVIADITPTGILCQANGKKFQVKLDLASQTGETIQKIATLLNAIPAATHKGDAKLFAKAAAQAIKAAECLQKGDSGCTHTNTSKLEAEKFTNDGEKKAEGEKAAPKGGSSKKDSDNPTTDTSKLESEKFTNDAEKKPEGEKAAAAKAEVRVATFKKVANEKEIGKPESVEKGMEQEGFSAGGKKVQDGGTLGKEEKFDAKEVKPGDVSGGESSIMGKDESLPKGAPKVPAGGGQMGEETLDGGNVKTKGTVIANQETQEQNREVPFAIKEARWKAASVYLTEAVANGEVNMKDFEKELNDISQLPVQSILEMTRRARTQRERITAAVEKRVAAVEPGIQKTASMPFAAVIPSGNEKNLTEQLSEMFTLTKRFKSEE